MIFAIPTDTCFWFATSLYDEAWFRLIYELKWREATKRLSMVVRDFNALKEIISINNEQIDFLKRYPYPFTVVWEKKTSFSLPNFLSAEDYSTIAVRVAEICLIKDLAENLTFPMFLTSANLSWMTETYTLDELFEQFGNNRHFTIFDWNTGNLPPSDIFSFKGSSLDFNYIRKNS